MISAVVMASRTPAFQTQFTVRSFWEKQFYKQSVVSEEGVFVDRQSHKIWVSYDY